MKARLLGISLAALLAACSAQHADLRIKPVGEDSTRPGDGSLVKAQLLLSRGEYALAIDAYRKAIRHDPANAAAYNGLAISYDGIGRFDLSRPNYELALARAPREAKYYRNLALSLKRQGKTDDAARVLAQMETATAVQTAAAVPAQQPKHRTLADMARDGLTNIADAAAGAIGPRLERLSMGEVRLSTAGAEQPPVRVAARSITVAIPVVEVRGPAVDVPVVPELAARPVGASITIELPEPEPIVQDEAAVELASPEPATDLPLAELRAGQAALPLAGGVQIAMAAEPAALLAMAVRPAAEPARTCETPSPATAHEMAAVGNASLAVFLGDYAPARLGRNSIALPLIYRASDNLPAPVHETAAASSCGVRMADSPAEADMLFTLLWRDMGGAA